LYDEKCLGFLDQRKQAKMQWVQDASHSNADNLNNVRHFRNKKKEYPKARIGELETDCKIKILGTFIGASMTSRRITSLELI
jgi:hypothetical protein